jgi:hypothetical protein
MSPMVNVAATDDNEMPRRGVHMACRVVAAW